MDPYHFEEQQLLNQVKNKKHKEQDKKIQHKCINIEKLYDSKFEEEIIANAKETEQNSIEKKIANIEANQ